MINNQNLDALYLSNSSLWKPEILLVEPQSVARQHRDNLDKRYRESEWANVSAHHIWDQRHEESVDNGVDVDVGGEREVLEVAFDGLHDIVQTHELIHNMALVKHWTLPCVQEASVFADKVWDQRREESVW